MATESEQQIKQNKNPINPLALGCAGAVLFATCLLVIELFIFKGFYSSFTFSVLLELDTFFDIGFFDIEIFWIKIFWTRFFWITMGMIEAAVIGFAVLYLLGWLYNKFI